MTILCTFLFAILLVICLLLAAGWLAEATCHDFTRAKLDAALNDDFPEFDVAPEDRA